MGELFILAFIVASFMSMICMIVFFVWRGKKLGIITAILIVLSGVSLYLGIRLTNWHRQIVRRDGTDYAYVVTSDDEDTFQSLSESTLDSSITYSENIVRSIFKEDEGWTITESWKGKASQIYFWIPVGKDIDAMPDVITEANWAGKYDQLWNEIDCDVFGVEKSDWDYGKICVSPQGAVVMLGEINNMPINYMRLK